MSETVLTDGHIYLVYKTKKDTMDIFSVYNKEEKYVSEIIFSEDDTKRMLDAEELRILDDADKAKILLLREKQNGYLFQRGEM